MNFWLIFLSILGLAYVGLIGGFASWDKGRRILALALRSLWLHKLRSFLSVSGIIIGTGAVIILMGFGEGSMQDALADIERQGATNIMVGSVKPTDDAVSARKSRVAEYGITMTDYDRFGTIGSLVRRVPVRIFPQDIRAIQRAYHGRVVGTTPEYAQTYKLKLAAGRFLRQEDQDDLRNVAVIGSNIARTLFPFNDPIGQTVYAGQHLWVIVGVLEDRVPLGAASGEAQSEGDVNDNIYIPLESCNRRFGDTVVIRQSGSFQREKVAMHQVILTVGDRDGVRPAGEVVRDLLDSRHPKKDWVVTVPLDKLEAAEKEKERFLVLLAVIAAISLLVGGIGIMNIMLATVTERTREIGIRRALGAKRRDITLQFLVEAVVQTNVGGLVGILIGLVAIYLAPPLLDWLFHKHMPAVLNASSVFYSLFMAVAVGVVFGLYPSWRAARLDPIEALRHD